jgi:ATP-dependent Clp protease ATP-binding subunit ClpB
MSTNPAGGGVDNIMNPNSYTEKAWEAIQKLPQYGDKYSAQYVEAPILFKSLLDEGQGGLTQRILAKTGTNINVIDKTLEDYLNKQPKVSDTSQKALGKSMIDALNKAQQIKKEFEDSFVSVEHLFLAVADSDSYIKRLLSDNGVKLNQLKDAVKSIRGSAKVTTRSAENTYESLKLYCRDLTEAAEEGMVYIQ